jgi:hypothetical protein
MRVLRGIDWYGEGVAGAGARFGALGVLGAGGVVAHEAGEFDDLTGDGDGLGGIFLVGVLLEAEEGERDQ